MKAIEFKNVTFKYEEAKENLLENVNFSLDYQKITLLTGFSGSGKSTILNIILGLVPSFIKGTLKGNVFINDENIKFLKIDDICKKVGVTLQNADSQIINQFVEDEIAFGCENMNIPKAEIDRRVKISANLMKLQLNSVTHTLSGGQKQRLITASTLATRQKILILDEPLANLDKLGTKILMDTLLKLKNNGYAILIIEHRIDQIISYVDETLILTDKTIIKETEKNLFLKQNTSVIKDISVLKEQNDVLFKFENVNFGFKDACIIGGINLEIKQGERLLFLGENGCGKTTLLRLIARLYKPKRGKIFQYLDPGFGQRARKSRKWFKTVGIVYQNPDYQLFMPTVRQEIEVTAASKSYSDYIINLLKLNPLLDKHPLSLSQGQKRLVSIASVLATKPKVLLLDEPTVGQDYEALLNLVNALNKIHDQTNNTLISITHDFRCAEALCDRCLIFQDKAFFIGGKQEVRKYFLKSTK